MNDSEYDALPARWESLTPHRDRVVATLRRRHVEYNEAEDVVHEAMLRLVQWDRLDPEHAGGALMTVAQRLAVDRHRRSGRERRAAARFRVPDGQRPDEIALDRLEARHLAQVVTTLSWRERSALEGRAQGMAPRETAARAGMPARSVHLALSRARATLRAAAAGTWAVLLWLRRSSVHRVAQPAAVAAAGAVLALHIAASPVVVSPATPPGGSTIHSTLSAPRHAAAPGHAGVAAPSAAHVQGVASQAQATTGQVLSSVGSKLGQVQQLLTPISKILGGTALPSVVSVVAGTLAHADAAIHQLEVLSAPPTLPLPALLPPLVIQAPHLG